MNGQLHAPAALSPRKQLPVPIEQDAGLASESLWTLWSREKLIASVGNRTLAVQYVVRRYAD
jgi:hypothetical protein